MCIRDSARICSIIKKAQEQGVQLRTPNDDELALLNSKEEKDLICLLYTSLAISVPKNKIEPIEKSIVRIKHIAFRDFESVICPPMRLLLCRFS